jgi:hypothetical protein
MPNIISLPHYLTIVPAVSPWKISIVSADSRVYASSVRTFQIVHKQYFYVQSKLTLATYQTSRSNFCSQLISLRPFTCAQPDMPGLNCGGASAPAYTAEGIYQSSGAADEAHFAFKIFHRLRQFVKAEARITFPFSSCAISTGARRPLVSTIIVRSLYSLNIPPLYPGLS